MPGAQARQGSKRGDTRRPGAATNLVRLKGYHMEEKQQRPVTIASFELENVKRVRAVALAPSPAGLTVIGGRNGQGKTSVLDAIAFALGGAKFRPSDPQREGSDTPPSLRVELSNGLIVERSGKNSELKVTDPKGMKGGQRLLDGFIEELALDLPAFLNSTPKGKAQTLLAIIGVGEQLDRLQQEEDSRFAERTAVGRLRDQKAAALQEAEHHPDAPTEAVSAAELVKRLEGIRRRNEENDAVRQGAGALQIRRGVLDAELAGLEEELAILSRRVEEKAAELSSAMFCIIICK